MALYRAYFEPTSASRRPIPVALVVLGLLAVAASALAPRYLNPIHFWATEDRAELERSDAHFVKLLVAFRAEQSRRSDAGLPPPPVPPAIAAAEQRLEQARKSLERAKRRPAHIGATLRYTGAALCLAGLVTLALGRRPKPAPTLEGAVGELPL